MGKQYDHLTYEERVLIGHMRKEGRSLREMSRRLGRAASTLSRELKRNRRAQQQYIPQTAQFLTRQRRKQSYCKPRLKTKWLQRYVRKKLKCGWRPEQISERLEILSHSPPISHEAIYQFIYDVGPELTTFLIRHHATRKKLRQSKKKRKISIPQRIPISERPVEVLLRSECGHWECDLMTSPKNCHAVQIAVERKSRFTKLRLLTSHSSLEHSQELVTSLREVPQRFRKTLTYDNGPENSLHRQINQQLGTQSYFCDRYKSWQKGTVENTIGRIRRTIKKGSDLRQLSFEALKRLERQLNLTPRKCLQYRTPMEVFKKERSVALQC